MKTKKQKVKIDNVEKLNKGKLRKIIGGTSPPFKPKYETAARSDNAG